MENWKYITIKLIKTINSDFVHKMKAKKHL